MNAEYLIQIGEALSGQEPEILPPPRFEKGVWLGSFSALEGKIFVFEHGGKRIHAEIEHGNVGLQKVKHTNLHYEAKDGVRPADAEMNNGPWELMYPFSGKGTMQRIDSITGETSLHKLEGPVSDVPLDELEMRLTNDGDIIYLHKGKEIGQVKPIVTPYGDRHAIFGGLDAYVQYPNVSEKELTFVVIKGTPVAEETNIFM